MLTRRRVYFLIIAALCLLQGLTTKPAHAQNESKVSAPSVTLDRMPPGAVSVRFETYQIGADTVGLHLFVLPKGRNPNAAIPPEPGKANSPITRAEIIASPDALKTSPFFADVFTRDSDTWTPRHRVEYLESGNPNAITIKYLRPARREGPIFFLDSGYSHWKNGVLIVMPQGVRSGKAFVQSFAWGGEGEFNYIVPHFDTTDNRGMLQVTEVSRIDEKTPETKRTYQWNGERFVDRTARYFVITKSAKTRDAANVYNKKLGMDTTEIIATSQYSLLEPHLFAVVTGRFRTLAEATQRMQELKKAGVDCYVKRAF
jgi:hypothetical protein